MRKTHLKSSGETRTEFFRGRLSPTESAQVQAALKDGGYASISDLLMAGLEALAILHSDTRTVQVGGTITTPQ